MLSLYFFIVDVFFFVGVCRGGEVMEGDVGGGRGCRWG